MGKMYVSVESITYADGSIVPLKIFWDDGRTWDIKRVIHMAEPVNNEFEGIRYTILIGSAVKNIYRLGASWYVYTIEGPGPTEADSS